MLRLKDLEEFREYLKSGQWEEDFSYRTQDGQGEMLDLIETLCECCEIADEIITKRFYKNMMGDEGKIH